MSTIAIVPSDVPSKRMLASRLAGLLLDAGHRPIMLLDDADDGDGLDRFEQRRLPVHPPTDWSSPRGRPLARRRANRRAMAQLDPHRVGRLLAETDPDLLVVDVEEYETLILVLALGEPPPLAALCSFFDLWPVPGLGVDDPGPAAGPADRMVGRVRWWWLWVRMRVHDARRHLGAGGIDRIAVSRLLARRHGVRRLFTARQWLHPFAPRSLPFLVCNALELDVPHRPRAGVIHIGSLLEPLDEPAPLSDPTLAAFVDRARAAGAPLVLCAFGTLSVGARAALLRCVAAVARRRPDLHFVVGAGDGAAQFDGLGNVHAATWVPQRAVLTVADAAVVHTGNATLHECVAARVPVVACPLGVNDQRRNAARVVRHRIGVVFDVARDDAAGLEALLDGVLGDEEMRRRLGDLAVEVTRYERDRVAVRAVEALLLPAGGHVSAAGRSRP